MTKTAGSGADEPLRGLTIVSGRSPGGGSGRREFEGVRSALESLPAAPSNIKRHERGRRRRTVRRAISAHTKHRHALRRRRIHALCVPNSMPATHLDWLASFDDMVTVVAVIRPLRLFAK